jgi:hypothetical protein
MTALLAMTLLSGYNAVWHAWGDFFSPFIIYFAYYICFNSSMITPSHHVTTQNILQ